ncbi:MAG TPA: metal-dependent hydrolase [Acidimicrobiales bacterium]|nr:metal-dependent hydrolase [Acidimicrobiales bacterium]
MAFEDSLREVPKHFAAGGDLVFSHIAATLSAVFPDGEDYFVRSVRHFRSAVDDPALLPQVSGFIGQEAMHGREHRIFNRRLAELGYPTLLFERATTLGLGVAEKVLPAKANLAVTAALEHFTATLAELLLADEEVRSLFGHDEVQGLFLWHALEESEHKAVAFDVYRHVGGSERLRRVVMDGVTLGFLGGVGLGLGISLLTDRATYNPRTLWRSLNRVVRSPIVRRSVWRELRAYNRQGFHPDDRDATALVEQWRVELFGENGSLTEKLVGTGRR